MFAVRSALRLGSRLSIPAVARRGCAGASIPVDDVVNGLTEDQIQVSSTANTQAEQVYMCYLSQISRRCKERSQTVIKMNPTVVNEFHRERERLFKEAVEMT